MKDFSFDKDRLLDKYKPDFAVAYGSGVFAQEGYSDQDKPMIDFIFGVNDPQDWHRHNLETNTKDYSLMVRLLGHNFINFLQQKACKIYYNPYVKFEDSTIKYGVISLDDMVRDFLEWKHLYVAGRMHKPVQILKTTDEVKRAIDLNLNHALNTALLLLPEHFTEKDLFLTITSLSYSGDHRMKYAENPKKADNIVGKNIDGFKDLYKDVLTSAGSRIIFLNDGQMEQSKEPSVLERAIEELPLNLATQVKANPIDLNNHNTVSLIVKRAITNIVKSTSTSQTMVGLFTAGLFKSARYVKDKLGKARAK
jgi:translocator assembly and maintenance protein 41